MGNQGPDEVWWNDGRGNFSDSEQALGKTRTRYVHLADLDGDLNAFTGGDKQGRIKTNPILKRAPLMPSTPPRMLIIIVLWL